LPSGRDNRINPLAERFNELEKARFGFKVPFYPLDLIDATIRYADSAFYDSIWTADHLLGLNPAKPDAYSAWSLLSIMAYKTKRAKIGSSVSDPCRMHPAVLAQNAMTVNEVSGGRLIVGLGCGEAQNTVPYGIDCDKPVRRLIEAIEILRGLHTRPEFDYEGRYYKMKAASIHPRPRPAPSIWVGANSPRTIEITGRLADGWLPMAIKFPPEKYKQSLISIKNVARASGRALNVFEPAIFLHTVASKDYDEAKALATAPGKLLLMMWAPELFEQIGITIDRDLRADTLVFSNRMIERLSRKLRELPEEPIHQRIIFGRPDDCIDRIEKYMEAGAKHFVISLLAPPEKCMDLLKLFTEKVVAYLREEKAL